ncbi:MAG TPA: hypothetical protein VGO09_00145, partial [Flavisolibacter sp.]|nr:hypothetical protein [Flavisolibacter sp.]
ELTINLELDINHNAKASKDRTNLFMGKAPFIPSEKTGKLIAEWCSQGEEAFNLISPGSEWFIKVEQCNTNKELVELYSKYKTDVDANFLLQQLISNRRNLINEKKLSAA